MADQVLSDRYELQGRLGSGGMSSVYRATDRVLERTVAVKVLAEHLSDDEKFVARFRREALAVAKLIHPNIVQVYDTGVDTDRHYIVMEYVEGRSGAQLLQSLGALSPQIAAGVGIQASAGLEYAHRHGIIHRDVKPGNLMIIGGPAARDGASSSDGEMTVKLTDFGIARAAEQTRLTQVGSVVGTAAYLAPEQARGDEATPSADVYALGVVLYQLLTGRLPYEGSTLAELAIRRENERPLSPSSYDASIPETLSAAVLGALEGEPSQRYGTAREFSEALRAGAAGEDPVTASEAATALATGSETAATRVAPRTESGPHEEATPVSPPRSSGSRRRPASAPPRPVITPAAQQRRRKGGAGRAVRIFALLIVLALLAAAIAGLVLLANGGGTTNASDSVRPTINDQISRLDEIIRGNTQ
jgi:eukaryotic-like serine/threonine-protein kinase